MTFKLKKNKIKQNRLGQLLMKIFTYYLLTKKTLFVKSQALTLLKSRYPID